VLAFSGDAQPYINDAQFPLPQALELMPPYKLK
jgi:hypothetical protein